VRLGVKTIVLGLAYKLEYVDEFAPETSCSKTMAFKVLIDPRACPTSTAPN